MYTESSEKTIPRSYSYGSFLLIMYKLRRIRRHPPFNCFIRPTTTNPLQRPSQQLFCSPAAAKAKTKAWEASTGRRLWCSGQPKGECFRKLVGGFTPQNHPLNTRVFPFIFNKPSILGVCTRIFFGNTQVVDNSWGGGLPTKVLDILPPWLTNLTPYT